MRTESTVLRKPTPSRRPTPTRSLVHMMTSHECFVIVIDHSDCSKKPGGIARRSIIPMWIWPGHNTPGPLDLSQNTKVALCGSGRNSISGEK
jgi:hypothetical protein